MAAAFMAITGALGGGGAAAGAATAASSLFAGGSAAGVAASTAAGGGLASTLTTVLSIGSALASIAQGSAQAAALEDQGNAGRGAGQSVARQGRAGSGRRWPRNMPTSPPSRRPCSSPTG
jgi:hypothetical protein